MRSFYNKYGAFDSIGRQANGEVYRFLDDFFKRWIAMGYNIREMQSLIVDETVSVSAREQLVKAMKMREDE